jgi:hypothetical protein
MKEIYKKVFEWIAKISSLRLYAVILLVTMALAYDAQVWRMGFYYDDWEGVFLYKQGFSALQIWNYFLKDRPFSFIDHVLFNPLLGASSVGWHILGLLLNWGAILFLVKALLQLWPKRIMEIGWVGLLLGVYPGMHRQFVVRTSIPHYTSMFLFTLSLWLMIKAFQNNKYRFFLFAASVLLALTQVLIIEYFSGLELIRALVLFYIFKESGKTWKQAIKPTLLAWLPYGLVFGGFLFYRFRILPAIQLAESAPKHAIEIVDQLLQDPLATTLHYIQIALQDILHAVLYVWTLPSAPHEIELQSQAAIFSWALGFVVALLCAVLMWNWYKKENPNQGEDRQSLWIVTLSVAALLLGGLPAWIIDRQAIQGIWGDRFLFGQIFGAVPLVVILIVWLTGQERRHIQNIVCAILLAGSLSLQFRVGNKYALNWQLQRDYYWQLKWRIPSIEPGTFIVSPYTPFDRNSGYQIAYATNVAFNSGYSKEAVLHWWFDGPSDLWDVRVQRYRLGDVNASIRSLTFESNTDHALPVIYRAGRGCLQVLDKVYELEPFIGGDERELFKLVNQGLIRPDEKQMPEDVFGQSPPHTWCYFYQKADLARQFKQWDQVLRIWDESASHRAELRYGPEYLPFIEAFAARGDWEKAVDLSITANATTVEMQYFLCANWVRIIAETPVSEAQTAGWEKVNEAFGCT